MIDLVFLNRLRVLSIIEGISTLILFFVAMPLKYFADMPMAVTVAGSVHGFLFIGLVLGFILGTDRIPISTKLAAGGIIGAVVPFGPFVTEIHLKKLAAAATQPAE